MKNLLIAVSIVLLSIPNANACSCTEIKQCLSKKIEDAFIHADLIFTGKVNNIKEINTIMPYKLSSDTFVYTFEVIKMVKGKTEKITLKILSANSGVSCRYKFQLEESYLVYSSISDYFRTKTGIESSFVTSLCRRN